ncbi:MAG: dihydrolipoamide acetyltransferase family protein [Phycisphaerales bacterium]
MPVEVTMPRLSDTMEQGTIVSWNVSEGDSVSSGDTLGDIETDKATMELQAFDDGVVAAILLEAGKTVDVGSLILVLAEEGEDPAGVKKQYAEAKSAGGGGKNEKKGEGKAEAGGSGDGTPEASTGTATAEPKETRASASGSSNGSAGTSTANGHASSGHADGGSRIFASPLAKKIAAEKGVDLAGINGSGPSGRIVSKDVESAGAGGGQRGRSVGERQRAATAPLPGLDAALEQRTIGLSNMRATIAKRLVESKQTVPHYQVTLAVNMDPLIELREQLNEQLASQKVKLSVNDFLVRACALAIHQHPYVNCSWGKDGKSLEQHAHINVGVAIALPVHEDGTGGGLVVATLRDADQLGLRHISGETKRLATKAREKGLTIEEMSDATFTISNLGMFGVEHFTAIINPPNAAILAMGAAVEKPVVRDGQIVVGHEMQMTMSSDHRVIDGAMAAQYLQTVKGLLEAPATLLV